MTTAPAATPAAAPWPATSLPAWEDLPFPNRFVLWTMRLWLAADTGDRAAAARVRGALEGIGSPDTIVLLDAMMDALASGARRPVSLAPVRALWLTDDEIRLVDALALAQSPGPVDVLMVLRPLLSVDGCRRLRRPCRAFARALAEAGLVLEGASRSGCTGGGGIGGKGDGPSATAVAGTVPASRPVSGRMGS